MTTPTLPEPAIQIAARLLAEGRPDEAAHRLAALASEAPTYAAAHVLHATALEAAGYSDDALAAWARASVLVPRSPLVRRERARLIEARRSGEAAPDGADPAAIAAPLAGTPLPGETERAEVDTMPQEDARLVDDSSAGAAEEPSPTVDSVEAEQLDAGDLVFSTPAEFAIPDPETAAWFSEEVDASEEPDAPAEADLLAPEDTAEGSSTTADASTDEPTDEDDGWVVLTEEGAPTPLFTDSPLDEPDAPTLGNDRPDADLLGEGFSVADELDSLISQLEDAPRIRPDPAFRGPAVSFDMEDADEVASETLAKIYEAQGQHAEAAGVYEKLAVRHPDRADEFAERAAQNRQRA